jgi:hypothetical protein
MAVCSEIRIKHMNTLRGHNAEYVNLNPGDTQQLLPFRGLIILNK